MLGNSEKQETIKGKDIKKTLAEENKTGFEKVSVGTSEQTENQPNFLEPCEGVDQEPKPEQKPSPVPRPQKGATTKEKQVDQPQLKAQNEPPKVSQPKKPNQPDKVLSTKEKKPVYRIIVEVSPQPDVNKHKPFAWGIEFFRGDFWYSEVEGWAETPAEAWEKALNYIA